ncbi:MAG: SPASM domain-containing protein [Planctomycetaceae bacterium]|nr:SPASM domain-containing protein [Planctomycetaceae bacterium]
MSDRRLASDGTWTVESAVQEAPPATSRTFEARGRATKSREAVPEVHPGSIPRAFAVTNLDFDVTENCNLGCLYCFKGDMYARHMSITTMKRTLDWLLEASSAADTVNCNFMGGEPTMRWKQIQEFVPWARRRGRSFGKNVTFSMTTNLTLFTDEMRQFVDAYGFGLLMSIDGCPEVQDAQRPAKNGVAVSGIVEKWARSMLETRPRSTARATIHPDYVHRMHEGFVYLHSIGFKDIAASGCEYNSWTEEHFATLDDQLGRIREFVFAAWQRGDTVNLSSFKYYINKLIHYRKSGRDSEIQFMVSPCGAGRGYMMVDYTGDIWPCHRFDGADTDANAGGQFRLGNIFKDGFNHDLQRVFLDFDHSVDHKDSCTTCPANPVCGGYCPAANISDTNSLYSPHDTYCRWTWTIYAHAERLYDQIAGLGKDELDRLVDVVSNSHASGEK